MTTAADKTHQRAPAHRSASVATRPPTTRSCDVKCASREENNFTENRLAEQKSRDALKYTPACLLNAVGAGAPSAAPLCFILSGFFDPPLKHGQPATRMHG